MSHMVTSGVNTSTLKIKPLVTHKGGAGRRTTITSFQSLLQTKQSEKTDPYEENNTNPVRNNRTGVTFRDPVTGQSVKYVEAGSEEEKKLSASKDTDKSPAKSSKTSSGNKTTTAASMKTTKYDAYFKKAAEKYGVSESLLKAIAKAESNFNPRDLSSSGAMGVMQLMPETARSLGVDDPYDPEQNIMGGAKCISQKLKEFNGDVRMALAAYNAGSGAVKRAGGIPSQCRTYVNRVLSYQKAFETAKKVG